MTMKRMPMTSASPSAASSSSSSSSSSSGEDSVNLNLGKERQEEAAAAAAARLRLGRQLNQQLFMPFAVPQFRRMTPQEDLMATLCGIDVLVKEREALIGQLVGHHQKLSRRKEIGKLEDFSSEIDRIMRMRGFVVKTPDLTRKNKSRIPQSPRRNATSFPDVTQMNSGGKPERPQFTTSTPMKNQF